MTLSARTTRRSLPILLAIFASAALGYSSTTFGGTQLQGEAVNDYTACGSVNTPNCIDNVNGFLVNMTHWPVANFWTNNDVWDRDFVDSDLSAFGGDNVGFDFSNNSVAIAYYSGHGHGFTGFDWDSACDNTSQTNHAHCCATSADCTQPGAGQSLPGVCTRGPGHTGKTGYCLYNRARQISTCSTHDAFQHVPALTTLARFGESSVSGSWRGAGTNGGINFAVMDMSIAVRPGLEVAEVGPIFAGLHNLATIMPTTADSDAYDVNYRGANFAGFWQMNPFSSPAYSWAFSIYSAGSMSGAACSPNGGDGYLGIDGCGAYWTGSLAASSSEAAYLNQQENWNQTQTDTHDATGASWVTWTYFCNYDCQTYPIHL